MAVSDLMRAESASEPPIREIAPLEVEEPVCDDDDGPAPLPLWVRTRRAVVSRAIVVGILVALVVTCGAVFLPLFAAGSVALCSLRPCAPDGIGFGDGSKTHACAERIVARAETHQLLSFRLVVSVTNPTVIPLVLSSWRVTIQLPPTAIHTREGRNYTSQQPARGRQLPSFRLPARQSATDDVPAALSFECTGGVRTLAPSAVSQARPPSNNTTTTMAAASPISPS